MKYGILQFNHSVPYFIFLGVKLVESEIAAEWIEVHIKTSTAGIEFVCSRLMDIGITGFAIEDSQDFEEFLRDKNGNWDYIDDDLMKLKSCDSKVIVYVQNDSLACENINSIKAELKALKDCDSDDKYGELEIELKNIAEEDWANNWRKYFKPMTVGNKLLIKPSWEKLDANESRTVLEIDPASSFGTGQHDTTQLCLKNLEKNIHKGDRLLDLGCGSGILGIAGILLGASQLTAVDIDDNAVKAAHENILKNNISEDCIKTFCGDISSDSDLRKEIGRGFDVVVANIVSDVLIAMSGYFSEFLADDGVLIVSGIIKQRKEEVMQVIEKCGFKEQTTIESEEWVCVSFSREDSVNSSVKNTCHTGTED